jgi:PST family polysaccharide transporter
MYGALIVVTSIASAILIVFANPIMKYGFGEQWLVAVPTLRILAIAGFVRSLVTVGGRVFAAAGSPSLDAVMNSVRVVVFAALVYPTSIWWGINGVALAVLISISCVVPMYLVLVNRLIGVSPARHLEAGCEFVVWLKAYVGGNRK